MKKMLLTLEVLRKYVRYGEKEAKYLFSRDSTASEV